MPRILVKNQKIDIATKTGNYITNGDVLTSEESECGIAFTRSRKTGNVQIWFVLRGAYENSWYKTSPDSSAESRTGKEWLIQQNELLPRSEWVGKRVLIVGGAWNTDSISKILKVNPDGMNGDVEIYANSTHIGYAMVEQGLYLILNHDEMPNLKWDEQIWQCRECKRIFHDMETLDMVVYENRKNQQNSDAYLFCKDTDHREIFEKKRFGENKWIYLHGNAGTIGIHPHTKKAIYTLEVDTWTPEDRQKINSVLADLPDEKHRPRIRRESKKRYFCGFSETNGFYAETLEDACKGYLSLNA